MWHSWCFFLSLARCSRSPQPDGFDQEADSLASANAGDFSPEHEGEQPRPSRAKATNSFRDDTSLAEGDDIVKRGCNAKVTC